MHLDNSSWYLSNAAGNLAPTMKEPYTADKQGGPG